MATISGGYHSLDRNREVVQSPQRFSATGERQTAAAELSIVIMLVRAQLVVVVHTGFWYIGRFRGLDGEFEFQDG